MPKTDDLTESFGYLSPDRSGPIGPPDTINSTLQDTEDLVRQAAEHDRKYGRDAERTISDDFIASQSTPLQNQNERNQKHSNQNQNNQKNNMKNQRQQNQHQSDRSNGQRASQNTNRRSWPGIPDTRSQSESEGLGQDMSRHTFEPFASPISPVTFNLDNFSKPSFETLHASDASTPLAARGGRLQRKNDVFKDYNSDSDHTFDRHRARLSSSPLTSPSHRTYSPESEKELENEGKKADFPKDTQAEQTIEILKEELRRQRLANEQLSGRISKLESRIDNQDTHKNNYVESEGSQPNNQNSRQTQDRRIHEKDPSVSEHLLRFKERLQIDKVDTLSSAEKSRLIKNLMLTLLVADFDHFPQTARKVGTYLSWTADFLDKLHSSMYTNEMRPSRYLFDYETDISGLEECLHGMLEHLDVR